jgi:TerB N-terminal domain/TerB-C domain
VLERSDYAAGRWIPPGQRAAVGAHAIPGGLIYLGRHVRSATGVEPALVNPDLPVAAPDGRPVDPGNGPRLAYHLLSPAARWAYLEWLAGGRRADVPAGLVLLFCFGLERRVLLDADHDPAVRGELPAIAAEVRRLRARYGDGGPILRGPLDNLLDLLDLLAGRPGTGTTGVRVALARLAAAGDPVPADLARVWVRRHPSLARRGAQAECPAEFDRMFALRYRDRHGAGLVPPHDVPGVRLRYQPVSPALTTTLVCRDDLPDVLAEPRCTRALGSLVDSVAAALDPYRRWLARFPEGRGSLAAAAHLPRELVDAGHGQLGALRVWAERQLDGRPRAVLDAAGFWAFWSAAEPDRMARDEAAAFLTVLALLDFGVEPDPRFGGPALARGPAVLFRLGRPVSDRPGARFPAAAGIVRCAAAVAGAAAPVHPQDPAGTAVLATVRDLAAALRLDPGEDLRLAARLGWLLTTRVAIDRLARHTTTLTAVEREIAGHYLVAVALAADPALGPATVAALTRVYRILGLEPDLVFHRLHEGSVGGAPALPRPQPATRRDDHHTQEPDGPVVVQVADATPTGYALPWSADRAGCAGVGLDPAAIERTIAESGAAATLLDAIFDAGEDREPAADRVAGLDPAHSALLRALATRPSWTRAEFVSLAAAHSMLPDGAVDVLNEVAIERAGAPVLEDGDTLTVDDDVISELLA